MVRADLQRRRAILVDRLAAEPMPSDELLMPIPRTTQALVDQAQTCLEVKQRQAAASHIHCGLTNIMHLAMLRRHHHHRCCWHLHEMERGLPRVHLEGPVIPTGELAELIANTQQPEVFHNLGHTV